MVVKTETVKTVTTTISLDEREVAELRAVLGKATYPTFCITDLYNRLRNPE